MPRLYMDIETLPAEDPPVINHLHESLKAPKTHTRPETIAKWLADPANLQKSIDKTSLSGLFGRIGCIGVASDTGPVQILSGDEKMQLIQLIQLMNSLCDGPGHAAVQLIGHNLFGFDLPFINQRLLVHQLEPLIPFDARPTTLGHSDTMLMFQSGTRDFTSLKDLTIALGLTPTYNPITGAQVASYWHAGHVDVVYQHCIADVTDTRRCFLHLSQLSENQQAAPLPELPGAIDTHTAPPPMEASA